MNWGKTKQNSIHLYGENKCALFKDNPLIYRELLRNHYNFPHTIVQWFLFTIVQWILSTIVQWILSATLDSDFTIQRRWQNLLSNVRAQLNTKILMISSRKKLLNFFPGKIKYIDFVYDKKMVWEFIRLRMFFFVWYNFVLTYNIFLYLNPISDDHTPLEKETKGCVN